MFDAIKKDVRAVRERDPAARNSFEVLLLSSGLHAIMMHRPAHWLYEHKAYLPARFLSQFSRFLTGIEIHPGAKIGQGVLIDHGMGVVIGETAEVGDGCTIYQGVTLGGTGKDKGKRHPTLGKNVTVGCGSQDSGTVQGRRRREGRGQRRAARIDSARLHGGGRSGAHRAGGRPQAQHPRPCPPARPGRAGDLQLQFRA